MANDKTRGRGLGARKPRSKSDYDNSVDGRSGRGLPPGNYTINETVAPVNLQRPMYKEGPMYIRPFPHIDFEEPNSVLQPGRLSAQPSGFSQWMVKVATANFVGIKDGGQLATFNLYHPKNKGGSSSNPYVIFFRACEQAHDAGTFNAGGKWDSQWNRLIKGSKNSGAAISPMKFSWYTQCAVYANGDKTFIGSGATPARDRPLGLAERDELVISTLSRSAGDGIFELMGRQKESWDGDPEEDFTAPFRYGDPIGVFDKKSKTITGGKFFTIFNPKKTPIKKATSWKGVISDMQGYEAAVSSKLVLDGVTYTPDIDAEGVKQIFSKSQFWFDDPEDSSQKGILRIEEFEQQALWIAQAFRPVPRLVKFAFADNPEFMTSEVKDILSSKVSMVVPGRDADDDADVEDDDDDEEDKVDNKRRGKKTDPTAAKGKPVKGKAKPADDDEEDEFEDDDEEEAKPGKKGAKAPPAKGKSKPVDDDEDDEDDVEAEDDDEEEEEAVKPGKRKAPPVEEEEDDDEEEEEEEEAVKPGKRKAPPVEDDEEEEEDDVEDDDDEEDDEEAEAAPIVKKSAKKVVEEEDDDEEEDDTEDEDDEEEEEEEEAVKPAKSKAPPAKGKSSPATAPVAKKGKAKPAEEDEEPEFEDDDAPAPADKMKKSLDAAGKAKGRGESRNAPPPPPPAPPKSKGGSAKKK